MNKGRSEWTSEVGGCRTNRPVDRAKAAVPDWLGSGTSMVIGVKVVSDTL
jgi:hypothetical protein